MLSTRYLPLYLALLGPVCAVSLSVEAVELMKWERIPLQVPLTVNYGLKMSHSYALKVRHFKTGF